MGKLMPSNIALEFALQYRSVMVFGTVRVLTDPDEAKRGLYGLITKYFPAWLLAGNTAKSPTRNSAPPRSMPSRSSRGAARKTGRMAPSKVTSGRRSIRSGLSNYKTSEVSKTSEVLFYFFLGKFRSDSNPMKISVNEMDNAPKMSRRILQSKVCHQAVVVCWACP